MPEETTFAPPFLNEHGDLQLDPDMPQMLRLFLEDVGLDPGWCDKVLAGIEDVRAGRQPVYHLSTDVTHLLVQPSGASFTIAAKLTRNEPVPIGLDELEAGLRAVRDFALSLPDEMRI